MTTFKDYPFYLFLTWAGLSIFILLGGFGYDFSEVLNGTSKILSVTEIYLLSALTCFGLMYLGFNRIKWLFPILIYLLTITLDWIITSSSTDLLAWGDNLLKTPLVVFLGITMKPLQFLAYYVWFLVGQKLFLIKWQKFTAAK